VNLPTEAAPSRLARALRATLALVVKLGRVGLDAVRRFFSDNCPQHAAGIAYRVLFSIAPLAIVLVSIFGLVLQDDSVRQDVVNTIVDALPVSTAGRKDVEDAITALATPASAVGFVSLLVFAWAATGMMGAIREGLESAMSVEESRPLARGKIVDLVLVLGAAALVLLSAGLTVLGDRVEEASVPLAEWIGIGAGTLAGSLLRAESFGVSVVVVMLLYRFVPARGLRLRDGLVGAVVTAGLLQAIALASGLIYDRASRLTVVYGSLTAALVFLYSVYLYASALLLGAEIATAWARPPVDDGAPPLVQLKRFARGLFARQGQTPPDDDRAGDLGQQSTGDGRRSADDP
jgi:membrane protein